MARELGVFNSGRAGKHKLGIYNGHPLSHLKVRFFLQSHLPFQVVCHLWSFPEYWVQEEVRKSQEILIQDA